MSKSLAIIALIFLIIIILLGVYLYEEGHVKQAEETTTNTYTSTGQGVTTTTTQKTTTSLVKWLPDGVIEEGEYTHNMSLSKGEFQLYWRIENGILYIALKGETTGWVAIGFGPTNVMKDADIVLGWVENDSATVLDMYSTGPTGPHPPDTKLGGTNDIQAYGGSARRTDGRL